ncbi:unnamed protein product, partial [Iphiclides podalirius]
MLVSRKANRHQNTMERTCIRLAISAPAVAAAGCYKTVKLDCTGANSRACRHTNRRGARRRKFTRYSAAKPSAVLMHVLDASLYPTNRCGCKRCLLT